jgi:cleavage and polyadenylation specificity factor subunit 4
VAQNANNAPAATALAAPKSTQGRKNYRQTVCRHWLRGLCMKGDACGFLHQYDKARMPVCRFFAKFGECREPDCIYKHTNEDIKECNMYVASFLPFAYLPNSCFPDTVVLFFPLSEQYFKVCLLRVCFW